MKETIPKILAFLTLANFIHVYASSASSERIYVGCYSCCFESNIFMPIPNPHNEGWNVVSTPKNFWAGINNTPTSKSEPIYFLKVKAKLGKSGQFGHMGLANHEMEITQVLEFRDYKKSDGVCDIPLPPEEDVSSPKTLESAVNIVLSEMSQEERIRLKNSSKDALHKTYGDWAEKRYKQFVLDNGGENTELFESSCAGDLCSEKNAAMAIVCGAWNSLNETPIRKGVHACAVPAFVVEPDTTKKGSE